MTESGYFDNAATTLLYDAVLQEMLEVSKNYPANPSAVHYPGLKAKEKLEELRSDFASFLKIKPETLYFTSGATESISIVISSFLNSLKKGKIIISEIEHEAVSSWISTLKDAGFEITRLKANKGLINTGDLEKLIDKDVRLICIQIVNNVIGSIQPIKEMVSITREKEKEFGRKIFFFSDAVQALCKIPFSLTELDVDGASFSAHKIKGPKGIGALYLKNPINVLAKAGGQEKGIRGGTENLASISGFNKALKLYSAENRDKINNINSKLRAFFEEKGFFILSPLTASPYILTLSTKLPSEVLTRMLSDEGFYISSGSACSNNAKGKAEKIIQAMGFPPSVQSGTIRISFSPCTDEKEALQLANLIYQKTKDF